MKCDEIRELLPLHAYGELSDAQLRIVDAHLADCSVCRTEATAFRKIRETLNAAAPEPVRTDLEKVYRAEASKRRNKERRWQFAATLLAAAILVVLAIRLDVRINQRQMIIRWGVVEPEAVVQQFEPKVPASDRVLQPEFEQRIRTMSELIQALAANVEASDRERQDQILKLKLELAAMNRQSQERMTETERDLSALYAAHFGSRPKAVNP